MFGNEGYKSFSLLHRLEMLASPKTCGKSFLYIGHFDIKWPHSIQINLKIGFSSDFNFYNKLNN